MAFLNPLFLLGILGISVPITIHLLTRMRPRPIKWAAMELLRKSMSVRSFRIRLEDILLLIMRCLVIALLALAMARPTITGQNAESLGIGRKMTGAVIAIDGSFSMKCKPTAKSRFDRALDYIDEIQKTFKPGDIISLLLMGNYPRMLLRNVAYEELKFENKVRNLNSLQESLNLELCLEQVHSLIDEMKTPVRECYILTDAQSISWGNLSDRARKTLQDISSQASIFVLAAEYNDDSNLSLTEFKPVSGSSRRGSWVRYAANIWNPGSQPRESVEVSLLRRGELIDKRIVNKIGPDEAISVPLLIYHDKPGDIELTAKLEWDQLATDNSRYLISHVHDNIRILCVNGVLANEPDQGRTNYIEKALVPRKSDGLPSLSVETSHWTDSWAERLPDYDVAILVNLPDINPDQTQLLYNFLKAGKGLFIFLGDKVNPHQFNVDMSLGQVSLMPCELLEVGQSDVEEGWPVEVVNPDHPLSNGLKSLPTELLNQARLYQLFKTGSRAGSHEILKAAGTDMPLLIEGQVGDGKVLIFTSSADRDWTNFPIHPAYPIMIHEAIAYLTIKSYERPVQIGKPLAVPLPFRSEQSTDVTIYDPSGKEISLQIGEQEGREIVRYKHTDSAGFYGLHAIGNAPILLAMNIDPSESNVRTLGEGELRASLMGIQAQILMTEANIRAAIKKSRIGQELWPVFVILSLIFLLLEGYFAHRFSKSA